MKLILATSLFLIFFSGITIAQTWQELPNAPAAQFVNDDIFFINDDIGWMVNLDGFIYKTYDGGDTWDTLIIQPGTAFRSIGFFDALHGFAGNLGPGSWISETTDTHPLYQTDNGGLTWTPVTNITGAEPAGICGINIVNDSVAYAVGRYAGPTVILKTTDAGLSWTSNDFSSQTWSLIDTYFFSQDTGIVVGGGNNRAVIYYTENGGVLWKKVFENVETNGWHWKISFPSRYVGYASIEGGNASHSKVAKTTDGGLTWELKPLINPDIDVTGIGFINDSVGWVGCWYPGIDFMTTDGGDTWTEVPLDPLFNRFRKVNENTAFICGESVWKLTTETVGLAEPLQSFQGYSLEQNFPNPFFNKTTIRYTIPEAGFVTLRVFDSGGRTIKRLVEKHQPAGTYTCDLEIPNLANGHFYGKLSVNGFLQRIKMIMVKE